MVSRRTMPSKARRGSMALTAVAGHARRGPRLLRASIVDGELDEIVVWISEIDAGRRAARTHARSRTGLGLDAVPLQERKDLVDRPIPFETEVGGADRRPPCAEVAGPRRCLGAVDVDLLRIVDPNRRHVWPAGPLFPGDGEAEPLVELQRAVEITRHDDPVIDGLDRHARFLRSVAMRPVEGRPLGRPSPSRFR